MEHDERQVLLNPENSQTCQKEGTLKPGGKFVDIIGFSVSVGSALCLSISAVCVQVSFS